MSVTLLHRRGSSAVRLANTLGAAELFFDTDLNALFIGDGVTAGGLPVGTGGTLRTVSKTTNYTVLTSDTGTHFNNIGASGTVIYSLPAAAAGLTFGLTDIAGHAVEFLANGSDKIFDGNTNGAAGGNILSALQFSFLMLEAHGTGQWITSSRTGTWILT